jgi:hypothetical protein
LLIGAALLLVFAAGARGQLIQASPDAAPAPAAAAPPAETACLREIRAAERRNRLPGHLLLAIGLTESGREVAGRLTVWPWTVNAGGQGRYFPDRDSAVAHVRSLRARGVRSIDVGCMQVNLHWHPDAFPDLATAFDPAANVSYAADLLRRHHGSLKNWSRSVRHYHSLNRHKGADYLDRVAANLRLALARRHDLADMPARQSQAGR